MIQANGKNGTLYSGIIAENLVHRVIPLIRNYSVYNIRAYTSMLRCTVDSIVRYNKIKSARVYQPSTLRLCLAGGDLQGVIRGFSLFDDDETTKAVHPGTTEHRRYSNFLVPKTAFPVPVR